MAGRHFVVQLQPFRHAHKRDMALPAIGSRVLAVTTRGVCIAKRQIFKMHAGRIAWQELKERAKAVPAALQEILAQPAGVPSWVIQPTIRAVIVYELRRDAADILKGSPRMPRLGQAKL
jgi:hypothetical protein